jgi:hypothetical protein
MALSFFESIIRFHYEIEAHALSRIEEQELDTDGHGRGNGAGQKSEKKKKDVGLDVGCLAQLIRPNTLDP